jgi:uncharacterized membrane protein
MNEFEVVTVIGRPADEVFAAVRDVAKTPLWTPGLAEVQRTSEGPLGWARRWSTWARFWVGGMSRR